MTAEEFKKIYQFVVKMLRPWHNDLFSDSPSSSPMGLVGIVSLLYAIVAIADGFINGKIGIICIGIGLLLLSPTLKLLKHINFIVVSVRGKKQPILNKEPQEEELAIKRWKEQYEKGEITLEVLEINIENFLKGIPPSKRSVA